MRKILVLPLLGSVLLLTSCKSSTVVNDLNTALGAVQVALPIIESAGLVSGPIGTSIDVALNAIQSAATELASKEPALTKAQFVNADISKAISELPPQASVPANLQPRIAAIQAALQAVLYDVQQSQTPTTAALLTKNASTSFGWHDRLKLKDIASKANSLKAQVK